MLIIGTIDHTQLQPVQGRPFLTSVHIIPCFRFVGLDMSVRSSNDEPFQRLQEIFQMNYCTLSSNNALVDEFLELCSENLSFVDDWTDVLITPDTYRLYSKKVPAKEAARDFVDRIRRSIAPANLCESHANDVEKSRYSHLEWGSASESTSIRLEAKLKEPSVLLFYRGALFEFTYNKDGCFSQSQAAILFDLPNQENLNNWKKVKVLAAPPGVKDISFDPTASKEYYLAQGYKEVSVSTAPERSQTVGDNIQDHCKQYSLKHQVTSTIHAAMGDTLLKMATEIFRSDPNFCMWDKGQLVVILSRTKRARDSIFVGNKIYVKMTK